MLDPVPDPAAADDPDAGADVRADPDAPGNFVDDTDGQIPEPNEPA